ncbi:hypothetical protein HN51_063136 [Arachis hypogaea]|uniref:Uncharacterized protein n=1 Tax=Arachis hypogaea TaxID=3818 RepID=A0A445AZD4_ARAHY|nr:nucleobase-ascorbate transporter 2 isoform X3 [Arachis hypogaea]XP_025629442.1 nucleobase-ascorbate transporter 2 isoform X3 [Arachis hypogaea]XP_025629443.1 nucleobase-ascorbate transporter 2 isoform X3 [Arachis hypogaea]XP_029146092.1 nucleobase-ascorbate transporter 2 isoform X3 [Arachis hypogaea]QHO20708.1 Nucleobase-ascorbate transporter [Arachis hypogaea]RYR31779.1 hypothetical protein Ahy_B01g056685 [Arachis hypogaea]
MKFSLYLWAMSLLAALLVKDLVFQMEHAKIAQRDILKWCNGIVGLGFSLRIEILSTMRAVQGSLIVASCIQIILGFSQIWAICSRFFSRLGMVPVIALVGFELFDRGFLEVGSWVEISMLILFIALSQDKGITRQIPSKTKRSTHDYVGLVNI